MNHIRTFLNALLVITLCSSAVLSQVQDQNTLDNIRRQQAQQGGTLIGKVSDEQSGEDLIGASVSIVNTKLGASTDIDGKFQIKKVPEGTYDVRVSFIGYETKLISGVLLTNNEQTVLNVSVREDQGIQQQEVVISASVIKSGEGAILAERKKAATIGDGISSEQMKKAPDATSGDALKRVTGVSLVDNKFVFVRGVTDRYNQTTLNGASVPSTSVDKKSFSFDMLPSNLLENMNIIKTATPDLPGDFTGGLVQLNTLDFPESRAIKFVMSGSFNSVTSLESFTRSQGGKNDWIGSDDGIRAFPSGSNTPQSISTLGNTLPNTWASRSSKAPLNQSMSLSIADHYSLEEDQFGFLAALSYRNSFQRVNSSENKFNGVTPLNNFNGTRDNFTALWGAIVDVNFKTEHHKFALKNNYNKAAEDKYITLKGQDIDNQQHVRSYLTEWEQRGMLSNQLSGEHAFPELYGITFDWMAFFSQSSTDQPDRKQVNYELAFGYNPESDPFNVSTNEIKTSRSWSKLYDRNLGEKINLTIPVGTAKLKFGVLNEVKNRHYDIRYYAVNISSLNKYELLNYGPDSIFRQENFGSGGFSMRDGTNPSDKYSAKHQVFASYAMLDIPFSIFDLHFRFTGGTRVERSIQNVLTNVSITSFSPYTSTIAKTDILPSANFAFLIDETQNLRFAYSQTVNRPELREMANVKFYDFDKYEYVTGNPYLTRALARNYDIRYEIFPEVGDLFAVSYFYKSISFPIEEKLEFSGFRTRTWFNADHAKNQGWELELRKNFGFIGEYFRNVQIVANYSRIYSEVPYKEDVSSSSVVKFVEGVRSMQGQSPYMYNISLFFTEPDLGTSVNILYNEFGSRIDLIGFIAAGDFNVYEHKRGTVDFSLTQSLSALIDGFELKYNVKNLNNQPIVKTHGTNISRYDEVGITHSLQASFSF